MRLLRLRLHNGLEGLLGCATPRNKRTYDGPIQAIGDDMKRLEARKAELNDRLSNAEEPQPFLHPKIAEIHRQRISTLPAAAARCIHLSEYNHVDLLSTLRYARVTKCTPSCDINRLRTPQNQIGTAFGTARFIWLSLSADDASLFWRVGPLHHRRNTEPMSLIWLHFNRSHKSLGRLVCTRFYAMTRQISPLFDASVHTERTRRGDPYQAQIWLVARPGATEGKVCQ